MAETRFTSDHEWVRMEDGIAVCGITAFAQSQLGDIVFVELPEVGHTLTAGKEAGVVESVKAASEVYAPLDGEVAEINTALIDNPALVNEDPEGAAWFFKLKFVDAAAFAALMDKAAYDALAGE